MVKVLSYISGKATNIWITKQKPHNHLSRCRKTFEKPIIAFTIKVMEKLEMESISQYTKDCMQQIYSQQQTKQGKSKHFY